MKILTQGTGGIDNYHGTIGTPTNMYSNDGDCLYVGDVVIIYTLGIDGNLSFNAGIAFVCEEDISKANWTGKNWQYVMGIASVYDSERFANVFDGIDVEDVEQFENAMNEINGEGKWRVDRVKSFKDLVIGEKIDFVYVDEVDE